MATREIDDLSLLVCQRQHQIPVASCQCVACGLGSLGRSWPGSTGWPFLSVSGGPSAERLAAWCRRSLNDRRLAIRMASTFCTGVLVESISLIVSSLMMISPSSLKLDRRNTRVKLNVASTST